MFKVLFLLLFCIIQHVICAYALWLSLRFRLMFAFLIVLWILVSVLHYFEKMYCFNVYLLCVKNIDSANDSKNLYILFDMMYTSYSVPFGKTVSYSRSLAYFTHLGEAAIARSSLLKTFYLYMYLHTFVGGCT